MKIDSRRMKIGGVLAAVLALSLIGVYFYTKGSGTSDSKSETSQTYLLASPAFTGAVGAGTTFLEQEAGMSVYVNTGGSIDVTKAKTTYKTIEKETSDYIVGSVFLPGLSETDDVHCFVHKDGWIVTYYLKAEPISKIIDWSYYSSGTLTKTKLSVGLEKMALALGATVTNAKYYNFQYPYADKWMIIVETSASGDDSFNLQIPSAFTIYERSWCLDSEYGILTAAQLGPDVSHVILARVGGSYSYLYLDGSTIKYVNDTPCNVAIILAYREA